MTSKKLLYIGLVIFCLSTIIGILGILWAMFDFLGSPRTNATTGIEAWGKGVFTAMIINVIAAFGTIIGLIMMIIGGIKLSQESKSNEQLN